MSTHLDRNRNLRETKQELAEKLLAIPESKHQEKPKDGGFTPAELMEHLAKAEEFNLKFLRKLGPKQIENRKVKPGPMYKSILDSFQNLKRTAAPPMLKPAKMPNMQEQHARWMTHLNEVDKFVSQVASSDAPFIKMNFLFGTLSADQFMDFQEAHIKYHNHSFPKE